MMDFTVLQGVYKKDSPAYLDEALESLAEQTLLPQRIVLVKDGELTVELENIISKWEKILPLYTCGYEQNQGLAYALNYGLQFVETELVARMDSDDICFPTRFEKQVLQFEIDSTLQVLGTGIKEFYNDSDGKSFTQNRLYPKLTDKKSKKLYRGTPLAHPTVMIKTELMRKFRYSENTKCNEDIDLWFRMLEHGITFKTLQEPLLHFRITDGTFKRRSFSKALNEFSIYSKYLSKFNGINSNLFFPFIRLLTRFQTNKLSKIIYLSKNRENLFLEKYMKIKSLKNYVFEKNGHLFEAIMEVTEGDKKIIKAIQLDTEIENVIEIPANDVKMYQLRNSINVQIDISSEDKANI